MGNRVFVSYSHKDWRILSRLKTFLKPLESALDLDVWDDTRISAGMKWRETIQDAISSSVAAILLVSADFIASDFIKHEELPKLLALAESGGTTVIPVIVGPSRFEKIESLARFAAVNPPSRPLMTMKRGEREQVFVKISSLIEDLLAAQSRVEPVRLENPIETPVAEFLSPPVGSQRDSPASEESGTEDLTASARGVLPAQQEPPPPVTVLQTAAAHEIAIATAEAISATADDQPSPPVEECMSGTDALPCRHEELVGTEAEREAAEHLGECSARSSNPGEDVTTSFADVYEIAHQMRDLAAFSIAGRDDGLAASSRDRAPILEPSEEQPTPIPLDAGAATSGIRTSPGDGAPSANNALGMPLTLSAEEPVNTITQESSQWAELIGELGGQMSELSAADKGLLEELKLIFRGKDRRKFTFLLMGRTGVGKSSTINSLMGEEVSPVDPFRRTTRRVTRYDGEIEGIRYSIVDTPGFCDADPKSGNDERYLAKVLGKVARIDCMWFVTRLGETRVGADEMRAIELISDKLGKQVWNRAIIVFTFADKVSRLRYPECLSVRAKLIRNEIAKHAPRRVARAVPAVAVANDEATHAPLLLPTGESWLGELYTDVFDRISDEGAVPFYLATKRRVVGASRTESKSTLTRLPTPRSNRHHSERRAKKGGKNGNAQDRSRAGRTAPVAGTRESVEYPAYVAAGARGSVATTATRAWPRKDAPTAPVGFFEHLAIGGGGPSLEGPTSELATNPAHALAQLTNRGPEKAAGFRAPTQAAASDAGKDSLQRTLAKAPGKPSAPAGPATSSPTVVANDGQAKPTIDSVASARLRSELERLMASRRLNERRPSEPAKSAPAASAKMSGSTPPKNVPIVLTREQELKREERAAQLPVLQKIAEATSRFGKDILSAARRVWGFFRGA
jgi:GTP-binding protein EngB required for normal cell division